MSQTTRLGVVWVLAVVEIPIVNRAIATADRIIKIHRIINT
jgi:hypothetical protein